MKTNPKKGTRATSGISQGKTTGKVLRKLTTKTKTRSDQSGKVAADK